MLRGRSVRLVAATTPALALVVLLVPARLANACLRPPPPHDDYSLEVISHGAPLTIYRHAGKSWVEGRRGERFSIRIANHTRRRVEVVVSVDGLDVVDGERADHRSKRGYLLAPHQTYDIDGYRLSYSEVATFRFSDIGDSYAARRGDARRVGVVEAAFYPGRRRPPRPRPHPIRPRGGARKTWDEAPGDAGAADAPAPKAEEMAPHTLDDRSWGGHGGILPRRPRARQRLGTEFGEARHSEVYETDFERADPRRPAQALSIRYDDRSGLAARGVLTAPTLCGCSDGGFAKPPVGW